jgi:hypothetical protein
MFKKILIVLMIGCFLLGMATRAEAENALKSTTTTGSSVESEDNVKYIPKVIIEARWGNGPGEFGFSPDPDVPSAATGPCGLVVDSDKLYILDAVNRRINAYSDGGSFLRAIDLKKESLELLFFNPGFTALEKDGENNFYLLGYDSPSGGSKILKFDSVGNFVNELCKSPVDEEFVRTPLVLPPPLLWKKERRDSLGVLLGSYKTRGIEAPSNLKAEYDSLDSILKDFRSLRERKEPLRISFDPVLKIKGDSLIVNVNGEEGLVYFDKKSGKNFTVKHKTRGEIKKWWYSGDYTETIRNLVGLSEDLKEFVLSSRDGAAVFTATGFDEDGNFYELLWDPCNYNNKGIKVIKWEKQNFIYSFFCIFN